MPYNRLSTAKIAKAVGCHPNTVRLYEEWGFLPPVPRAANGYRLYQPEHLHQMRLARAALNTPWPGKAIRRSSLEIISISASGDLGAALEKAIQPSGFGPIRTGPGSDNSRIGFTLGTGNSCR